MTPISPKCILALSLDWQGFGFVVFEGPNDLIDYGTRSFPSKVKIPMETKLVLLLDANRPDTLVLVEPTTTRRKKIATEIANVAKIERVPLVVVSNADIHKAFAPENQNKYRIAAAIADRYPELLLRLPAPRKSWQSEQFGITIFEAAAATCVCYGQTITPLEG